MALKLGATTLTALYLGSTAIATAYLGSTEVYTTGGAFSPASLFASGEEGAWYEPSTTTAFSDLGGFNFATYGQGVAHLVDKSKGATIEARRNLLLRTEEFNNGYWSTTNATVDFDSSSTTDPLGGNTADKLVEVNNNGNHFISTSITPSSTGDYTMSIYAKANGRSVIQASPSGNWLTSSYVNFDLSAEEVSASNNATGFIEKIGDGGWYRCSATLTVSSAVSGGMAWFLQNSPTALRGASYLGDGTSGIYIWGAQLEAGSSASAYQKITDGQTVSWLPGNHATQVTAGARPLLQQTGGGVDYLFDDEADDVLPWAAPTDTDYTIAYVNTSGTVTILTGQSLSGATDILLDPALVGYVAVDRALTSQETTDLTAYLEALA